MCLTQAGSWPAHLTRVHQALGALPRDDQRRLGVVADWKNGPHTLSAGAGVPGPAAGPGDALVLDLPAVPVRPLADYAIGGLS